MTFFKARLAQGAGFLLALWFALTLHASGNAVVQNEFLPGKIWQDTDGHPINAHGGGIIFSDGVYYWYGEAKSGHTFLPDCNKSWGGTRVDTSGVSCYSSTNLYDWKNEGLALKAEPNDSASDLHPSKVLERPKVVYNRAAKEFAAWMHVDSPALRRSQSRRSGVSAITHWTRFIIWEVSARTLAPGRRMSPDQDRKSHLH